MLHKIIMSSCVPPGGVANPFLFLLTIDSSIEKSASQAERHRRTHWVLKNVLWAVNRQLQRLSQNAMLLRRWRKKMLGQLWALNGGSQRRWSSFLLAIGRTWIKNTHFMNILLISKYPHSLNVLTLRAFTLVRRLLVITENCRKLWFCKCIESLIALHHCARDLNLNGLNSFFFWVAQLLE